MKKFTAAVTALHEAETSAKSELQKSYTEYFSAKLNKFGAKSPADLSPEQKSEFFSEISKDWERGVGAKPAGKKDVEEHGVKESEVNEGMISPKMANGFKIGDKIKTQKGTYTITGFGSRTGATRDFEAENEKGEQFNLRVSLRGATGIQVAAGKSLNFPEQEEMLESEEVNEGDMTKDYDGFIILDLKGQKTYKFKYVKGNSNVKVENDAIDKVVKSTGLSRSNFAVHGFVKKGEWDKNDTPVLESVTNEAEVKSDADFKEYAEKVLKKAHGDKYDEAKAAKTIEGILKKADGDYGAAVGIINSSLGESNDVNEAKEIKSDSEFKEYAQTVLKKAFGDKYDEEKAMKTAEGILKKSDGDYGAAVGMLTSSLGESKDVNEAETCSMCGKEECECYKEKDANESVNPLNEGATLYVSNPKFKDEASLKADILKNVGPALDNLLARNGVKYNAITAKEGRGRIELDSKPITGKDLGIMQYGFKSVWINSFGGGSFPQINKAAGEAFEFSPYIWFNLHYSYEHGAAWMNSTGSNGCSLYLPSERTSNVYYDVIEGRFLLESEAERRSDWK